MSRFLNKKTLIIILCAMMFLAAALIAVVVRQGTSNPFGKEVGSFISEKDVPRVGEVLRAAGLSNVDIFETWVYEYLENKDSNFQSDAYSDADCRLTAMLLAEKQLSCKDPEEYQGDYLMIDVDKLRNDNSFVILSDNTNDFTTMFGETPIPASGFKDALPQKWKKHDIKFYNDYCKIVNLVFQTMDTNEAFVGHTGILVDCRELSGVEANSNYLFVEKLAFNDAFMASELNDPSDLINLFSQRDDYKTEEGEAKPLVYLNDEFLGELK